MNFGHGVVKICATLTQADSNKTKRINDGHSEQDEAPTILPEHMPSSCGLVLEKRGKAAHDEKALDQM